MNQSTAVATAGASAKPPAKPLTPGGALAAFVPQDSAQLFKLAETLAQSGDMIPKSFQGNPNAIVAAVMRGMEIGLAPIQSLASIAVINGRASLWGDALPALMQRAGHHVDVEYEGEGDKLTAIATLTRGDTGKRVVRSFSLADAPAVAEAALATLKEQLTGKVIGVQTGSTAASFTAEYFAGLDVREYPSFEQLGLELTAGRLDVAIANVTAFKAVIDANAPGTLMLTGPTFSGGVLGLGTTNVALRQGEDALREAFDAAIAEINADGTNTALTEKWFGVDISARP